VPPRGGQRGLWLARFIEAHETIERQRDEALLFGELGGIERGDARLDLDAQGSAIMGPGGG